MASIKILRSHLFRLALCALCTSSLFMNCSGGGFEVSPNIAASGSDPLLKYAWYIENDGQSVFASQKAESGFDLNMTKTWADGYSGKGIRILISDDGVEDTHEDLKNNFLYSNLSKDYTLNSPYMANASAPRTSADIHGTAVAGLVAGVGDNGLGVKGIAYKSSISSANFLSAAVDTLTAFMVDQASGSYDIFNMSWGSVQNELVAEVPAFMAQLRYGALNYRDGKGAIYVKAAGNDFAVYCNGSDEEICIGNAGFDADNSSPFLVIVGALSADGYASSYSSMGSNLWVASFGGEFGDDSPAMITTDRSGCTHGFSKSNSSSDIGFQKGRSSENGSCKYSATFNGTSSAAPVASGVIALILEANPDLTWRDVKYILAKTAAPVNYVTTGSISHPTETVPAGAIWERPWVANAAGFKFHNYYGFGKVDVDAAIALAKSYTSSFGSYQEPSIEQRTGLSLSIPDFSATGVSDTISIATDLKIESVQLQIYITHTDISDLALELTSPSGTKSYLTNMNNSLVGIVDYVGEVFLSNAFYQEESAGTWTLKIIDGKNNGTNGTLTRWGLKFSGSN